ncbi:uncharacterized protein PAC_19946 [Phialocephala subalpina]|uniref:Uncharacterized protein n=1 Tax=Phialocephala subalpina TaxID=576137 RepID=A0A1L7XYM5_9HELO|nr:uncharacterized protein PAC_19946 [Phialocephala subalpina]
MTGRQRTSRIVQRIEQGVLAQGNDGNTMGRADEAAAEIGRSPTPPIQQQMPRPSVPPRPKRFRAQQQHEEQQTLPPSPQDGFHPQRGRLETLIPKHEPHEVTTPENDSSISLDGLQNQLSNVKDEIRSLRTELQVRERAVISVRHDLDEAVEKYDQAILDLQRSQREKNALQEQVERLRNELKQEREARSELEREIEERIQKELRLLDMLERTSKISQTRIEESILATERRTREAEEADQERAARSARVETPRRGGTERRRTPQTIINIKGRSESRVSWVGLFKSDQERKSREEKKGKRQERKAIGP